MASTSAPGPASGAGPTPEGGGEAGGTFKVHPLLLLNISDHYIRMRAQAPDAGAPGTSSGPSPPPVPHVRVMGVLLGVQAGRTAELYNSFELVYVPGEGGLPLIDDAFMKTKQEQCARAAGDRFGRGEKRRDQSILGGALCPLSTRWGHPPRPPLCGFLAAMGPYLVGCTARGEFGRSDLGPDGPRKRGDRHAPFLIGPGPLFVPPIPPPPRTHPLFSDKKVFPTLDVLGWYSTGSVPCDADMAVHRKARRTRPGKEGGKARIGIDSALCHRTLPPPS